LTADTTATARLRGVLIFGREFDARSDSPELFRHTVIEISRFELAHDSRLTRAVASLFLAQITFSFLIHPVIPDSSGDRSAGIERLTLMSLRPLTAIQRRVIGGICRTVLFTGRFVEQLE
jgi:hypothetical protein